MSVCRAIYPCKFRSQTLQTQLGFSWKFIELNLRLNLWIATLRLRFIYNNEQSVKSILFGKSLKVRHYVAKNELIRYLNLNAKFYNKYNQKLSENILDVIKRDINKQQLFNRELQYKRIIGKNNKTLGYEFIYG